MKTTCRDCVFAVAEDGIQLDCQLDKLDKFIKQERAEITEYGHYEILGICKYVCTRKWAEKQSVPLKEAIYEETKNKFTIIVIDTENDGLEKTLKSLLLSKLTPYQIVAVSKNPNFANPENLKLLDIIGVPYKLTINFGQMSDIDEAFTNVKGNYYLVMNTGDELPDDFLTKTNDLIDSDNYYLYIDSRYPTVSSFLNRLLGGDKDESLLEKFKALPHFSEKYYLNGQDFNDYYQS